MSIELRIPEVGESVTEAQVARWLKKEGQRVEKDEGVVELETDKASLELPAPAAGRLTGPLKKEGGTAAIGEVIGYIQEEGEGGGGSEARGVVAAESSGFKPKPKLESGLSPRPDSQSPALRSTQKTPEPPESPEALEKPEVPRQEETGARQDAREDEGVSKKSAAETAAPQEEGIPQGSGEPQDSGGLSDDREEEVVPMTPMRRRIAQRLVQAQQNAALLTTFNEADMSGVNALRKQFQEVFQAKYKIKLGFMSFFVKAAIDALKQFPGLNARISGTDIIYRNYYDIGIAISTERGLVVPVLRNAQQMSFAEVELAIADLAARARESRLRLEELQGGTFTITNGGVFGSLLSTPIVNPPQSGVLGMHTIQERPVARQGQVVIRPMMYLALTYDHRIVDGREAIGFLNRVIAAIEEPARMLIEV